MPQIFDADTMKYQLEKANRNYEGRKLWQSLYGGIDLSRQRSLGALETQYTSDVAEAYATAQRNQMSVASSNLGEGYKQSLQSDIDIALQQAYDTYQSQYAQEMMNIEQTAAQSSEAISQAASQQAEYYAQLAESPYQYLQYMYETYGAEENGIFANDWKNYLAYDQEGMPSLRTWDDLVAFGILPKTEGTTQTGLFDSQGKLTVEGQEFYKQMMDQMSHQQLMDESGNAYTSYETWLRDTNPELFNWAYGSTTGAESNYASFRKEFLGIDDYGYDANRYNLSKMAPEEFDTYLQTQFVSPDVVRSRPAVMPSYSTNAVTQQDVRSQQAMAMEQLFSAIDKTGYKAEIEKMLGKPLSEYDTKNVTYEDYEKVYNKVINFMKKKYEQSKKF